MYVLLYWKLLIIKKFFPTSAKRECTSELCRRLLKHRLPLPRVSDSLGLGWEPEICMSNRVAGDPNAAGLGLHFENRNLALRLATFTKGNKLWVWWKAFNGTEYMVTFILLREIFSACAQGNVTLCTKIAKHCYNA